MKRFVSVGESMVEMSGGDTGTYHLGFAGDTLNTAWYARALLGADWQIDYVTAFGDDLYSDRMLAFIKAGNIGTDHIQIITGKRAGLYLIHQAEGDRHFTYWRENAAARQLADDRDVLQAAFAGASMIYFSGITLAILAPKARGRLLKAIVTARDAGAQIAFDPNIRPALWSSSKGMQAVITAAASIADIILPTYGDEHTLFGDSDPKATVRRYLDGGSSEIIVKNGAEAALAEAADDHASVAPPDVTVVDATGAGDAFNGAYLAGRLQGKDLRQSLISAHAVAGTVIGHHGALIDPNLLPTV